MARTDDKKRNTSSGKMTGDVIAVIVVIALIFGYVVYQCYRATHVDVETITAVSSTVYETIDTKALVVRDEKVMNSVSSGVMVAACDDGEKIKLKGNAAYVFASEDNAKSYSQLEQYREQLDYYLELQNQSAGIATDIASIDKDIINDVNDYVRNVNSSGYTSISTSANELNDKLTRRQLIIGDNVDFSSVINDLQQKIKSLESSSISPTSVVKADESGVYSSYTDGLESAFDYKNIKDIDESTLQKYIKQAESAEKVSNSPGKLITSYEWYFCSVVDSDKVSGIKNGGTLSVALKNSDKVLNCTVVSGANPNLGQKKTVLILSCSQIDADIASMRMEDIEIRYKEYKGFKVPSSAIHVDEKGQKCVYALVANQVSLRQSEVLYQTKDYTIFKYDAKNSKSIRYYDQIITKGNDLHDGKIYS